MVEKGNDVSTEDKQITLRLGHEMPEDHPYQYGAVRFAELVAQKTDNKVKIEVFPNGTLGTQAQLVEGVSMGTIDLAEAVTIILEKYAPRLGVFTLPYMFRDWEHVYKTVDGPMGDRFSEMVEPKGIKILAYFQNGVTHINSRAPINSVKDVKGLKLRVQSGPSFVETGKALEAVVTPMPYSEIYAALQMGTIDAQIQQANNMRANKHYEVAKHFILNNMCFMVEPLMISKDVYDRLPEDIQKALVKAAKEAAVEQREYAEQMAQEDLEYMKQQGLEVVEADIEEWKKVLLPVYDEFPEWQNLIDEIQAVK